MPNTSMNNHTQYQMHNLKYQIHYLRHCALNAFFIDNQMTPQFLALVLEISAYVNNNNMLCSKVPKSMEARIQKVVKNKETALFIATCNFLIGENPPRKTCLRGVGRAGVQAKRAKLPGMRVHRLLVCLVPSPCY